MLDLTRRRPSRWFRVWPPEGGLGSIFIADLQLNSDGVAAAVIASRFSVPQYEVVRLAARGEVLAEGAGIDPHSLALGRTTLYWTQDGTPRSASVEG